MTSPDCVSAGLGIDVIEADAVPNVRDLFEAAFLKSGVWPGHVLRDSTGCYSFQCVDDAWRYFKAGYRAAGGQGA